MQNTNAIRSTEEIWTIIFTKIQTSHNMANVILYTRVSTDEQAEKGFSLRDQKEKLERFADANGYTVVHHFQDDHSAKTFDRPAFKKLLDFVKSLIDFQET